MATCVHCDGQMQTLRRAHRYVESGLSFVVLTNVIFFVCLCGEQAQLPDAKSLSVAIAEQLIRRPVRLTAEAVRFLRKTFAMASDGMTSEAFAELLGTTRQEVSRWENGHANVGEISDLRLRLQVIDKVLPARATNRRLRDEIVDMLVLQSLPPEDVSAGDITIDAMPYYPRKGSRGNRESRAIIGAGART